MSESDQAKPSSTANPIPFKAETRQLLEILIHSLYTNREIFLRELISNASDALVRVDFEMLTRRDILDPDAELSIRVIPNKDDDTLVIEDTGIGMNRQELEEDLGTIAKSGAKAFMAATQESAKNLSDIIGQFGVGFYSAFMVADWIRVESRSYLPEAEAYAWQSAGADTFTIEPVEKANRGTRVIIKLKDDAKEFLESGRLRDIIRKHSDFIAFPIYISDETEQVNRQTALWRQQPRQVEEKEYFDFYKQFTLDFEDPLTHAHMAVDAPVQMYALLFIPKLGERSMFSPRSEDGLKLYSRKILIQEYCKDLLPQYFRFIPGVVDSEDLPLNVSRESVQSNRVMAQLKKLVTGKVIEIIGKLAQEKPDQYAVFWEAHGQNIKEGIATDPVEGENLKPFLRFHTNLESKKWSSLDDYIQRMKPEQKQIYYILGEDDRSVRFSPHLDLVKNHGYEVVLFTDPMDPFVLLNLKSYKDHSLENVATAKIEPAKEADTKTEEPSEKLAVDDYPALIERFKAVLGDKVTAVHMTDRLSDSPARLVDPEGTLNPEMQRVYKMIRKEYETPKKVLELNPKHPILTRLNVISADNPLNRIVIELIYEDALLVEGIHPEPASMIGRIQELIEAALKE